MTDIEMLEFAAKAAGGISTNGVGYFFDFRVEKEWNPLTDDGDALRLAVKLKLNVNGWGAGASATAFTKEVAVAEPHYGDDPERATRLAIVRAAAEIGKSME